MSSRMMRSGAIAILLTGVTGFALAQSDPANPAAANPAQSSPTTRESPAPTGPIPATQASPERHNSTTGAASTDVPNPPVVVHIPSPSDAAKFNAAADARANMPTMAHALALTDEQRRFISSSIAGKSEASDKADFKPEVSALMPKSAKVHDLPAEIGAKIPWVRPYKYAVVDDKILLVDPVNSYIVLGILNR